MQALRAWVTPCAETPARLLEGPGHRPVNVHSVRPQTLLGVSEHVRQDPALTAPLAWNFLESFHEWVHGQQ